VQPERGKHCKGRNSTAVLALFPSQGATVDADLPPLPTSPSRSLPALVHCRSKENAETHFISILLRPFPTSLTLALRDRPADTLGDDDSEEDSEEEGGDDEGFLEEVNEEGEVVFDLYRGRGQGGVEKERQYVHHCRHLSPALRDDADRESEKGRGEQRRTRTSPPCLSVHPFFSINTVGRPVESKYVLTTVPSSFERPETEDLPKKEGVKVG
jgi:hypothetical protein